MDDIQALVDALAAELHRPTGVDDRHFRSIAYSSHSEGVDPVRLASILQREAPPAVRRWLEQLGVQTAESHLRVPANPALDMAARVCVPLRFDSVLLGYLWLIDEPEPLSDSELQDAHRYAQVLATALYRARLLEREDRQRERELIARLIGLRDGDPVSAGEELLRGEHLVQARGYAVIVLSAVCEGGADPPDSVRVRLIDAAEHLRRAVAPHHLLSVADASQVVVVLALATATELPRRAEALAAAASAPDAADWRPVLGVSEERAALAGLRSAYGHARAAARVATAIAGHGIIASWEDIGAYRTVIGLLGERDPQELLPESFRHLLGSNEAPILIDTLERYLDLGGDARAAAELLFIHRSSLYGRLHRIEQIAGVDLRSGADRLELHLAMRLWRLGGSPSSG